MRDRPKPADSRLASAMLSHGREREIADVFLDRSQSSDISQTVSMLRNGRFTSYDMETPVYHVGNIAPYPLMRIWFAENFVLLLVIVMLLSLALAKYARDYLTLLTAARLTVDPS